MTTYVALLRAINVGGHNMIKMAELKRMFEALGLGRVQTYIQSGNVLFESADEEAPLRRRIEDEIRVFFGFPVTVVLRTAGQMEQVVEACPFAADNLKEGESLYVSLLAEAPSQEGIDRLLASHSDTDECRFAGREIYILCRQGISKSKFANNFLEQKLGVPATARNWQTMTKLVAMGKAIDSVRG